MELFVLFLLVIIWFASGFYCSVVTNSKGHNGTAQAFGGIFSGFIVLIVVAGLPDRKLRNYIRLIREKQLAINSENIEGNDKFKWK